MKRKNVTIPHCTRHQHRWTLLLVALFLGVGGLLVLARPAAAATITVDGTTCTLVEAITAANNDNAAGNGCTDGSGADTITLLSDVTLTVADNSVASSDNGLPQIVSNITIEGGGHTISRAANAPVFRLFSVASSGTLTLNWLTLQNGRTNKGQHGGGIYNNGTVTVSNSTFRSNAAGYGGGISNNGTLMMSNSTFRSNTADNDGGGIYHNYPHNATVSNSTFSGNSVGNAGGGIWNYYGTLTVSNSTFSGNSASNSGGGIGSMGAMTLARNLLSGNTGTSGAELHLFNGTINGNGYNLIGYGGNARSVGFTPSGSNIVPTQSLAQIHDTTLQVNGSGPATHALVPGSPALDAAGGSGLIATDQRGVARPQGAADDIGAVEVANNPTLKVESAGVSLVNGDKINVPVVFTGNGAPIASVGFALTYDTVCLLFDPTDSDSNGVPNAISGLPAGFASSLSYNATNNTLEVALYDDLQPINSFSDGALLTVEFTVKPACITTDGSSKTVSVGFAASPAPSFGGPTGQDVTGTATGATITLGFNAAPSAPSALALSNRSVAENSAISTTVGTLSTTDLDASDSFTYSLVSGTGSADNASFMIISDTLKTAAIFDYETKPSYTVRVRTTDSGGLFFEQSFPITIIDVAEVVTAVDDLVDPRTTVFRGGQTKAIDVLANDSPSGGVLQVASVTQPATGGGSVLNNTSNISYTAPQASGNVTFTYQATDGTTTSNPATVRAAYVANHAPGDCNGNGNVTAADFIGVVLEIFDTNDTLYAGSPAWWLGYTGDYPGSPLGCDANNSGNGASFTNDSVTAADIICTVLIFFGHECGTAVQAAGVTATAHLAVTDAQAVAGATTTLTVTLNTGDNAIAAATFALELDPAALHFDPTDANEDGVPDAITLNTPAGMSQSASWNAEAHRLEVAVFGLSLPLPTLKDGTLATVTIAVDPAPPVSTTPLTLDLVSFSDPDGNDLPFTEADGTLTIDTSNVQRSLFLPLVAR